MNYEHHAAGWHFLGAIQARSQQYVLVDERIMMMKLMANQLLV